MEEGFQAARADDCAEAEKRFVLAVREAERFGPGDMRMLQALSNLGAAQDQLGEHKQAEMSYRGALDVLAASHSSDHQRIGALWHNVGLLAVRRKNFKNAETAYKKAIAEFKRAKDRGFLGKAYMELATLYNLLNRDGEAETLYQRAIKILRASRSFRELSRACTNLAFLYSYHRRMNLAWDNYECALDSAEKAGGLVDRKNRDLVAGFAKDLSLAGLDSKATDMDAIVAKIDTLPPQKPGACQIPRDISQ
jgi:tetratricopeptide (TPR) repeat protein